MRDILYRQKLKPQYVKNNEHFHYWGFTDRGFISPVGENISEYKGDQFTGLLDAKGNKVFEGDLLGTDYVEPREVIFEDGAFRFKDDNSNQRNQELVPLTVGRLNVIGNIYQHPHLIKGDE